MCEEFESLIIKYLRDASIYTEDECVWEIIEKEPFGRCLIAKRDIQANELILYDKPLLIGPRVNNYDKIFCVCCYKILTKLTLCTAKCKFPICHDCASSKQHKKECELIKSWGLKDEPRYSKHLFRALTVIRGLLLSKDDTKLMFMMASHENSSQQNLEVEKIINEFESLTADCVTIRTLKKISSVLNTNAFEVGIAFNDSGPEHNISLRGLYPLAAVMNHNCVPNIRYAYEKNSIMAVRASKFIPKGEQIFNSYTKFLWGTQQRRVHLAYSKNFLCECQRCLDPTELGSYIAALKCIRPGCKSVMLPNDPLVVTSMWECRECNLKLDHARISKISDIFSKQIFQKILNEPISAINHYLKEKLSNILPSSNQFTIEVKLQIILRMKQDPNYVMTLEDYEDVERYCNDVLFIIDRLAVGECYVKGLLYHELLTAKMKLVELRNQGFDNDTRKYFAEMLQKCWLILGNTTKEPKDLKSLIKNF
ncbi:CLUMA_CG015278, isoform A [Clunio marinus]|uniref:CLUMA_CG015278, isoform A n=1 Tax=Clunio marinus TaxID=568069 RepID=A0A1J1IR78_9DIPT|nr:CLUMA_CG015278, isoform A [Clunio marinus]